VQEQTPGNLEGDSKSERSGKQKKRLSKLARQVLFDFPRGKKTSKMETTKNHKNIDGNGKKHRLIKPGFSLVALNSLLDMPRNQREGAME